MAIRLYNTLSKQKEEFVPLHEGKVSFYMCGPTVYDLIHIGNARAFIVFDVLRKFLQFKKYDVKYVLNLTDIDDRIIDRSRREKRSTEEITRVYSDAFLEDLEALGVAPADENPRATTHVDDIVNLIAELVERGHAYEAEGDVYFDVSKSAGYGKLSGKKTDELKSGARVEVSAKKRNALDFVLWKGQKPGEPAWDSPWGKGRPGWHIECSAMSMKHLGETFDIHAGGVDLIFPHHENEIAQSEGATGKSFVKYWLHNGFLNIDGDKMSKSLGNIRSVRDVLKHYSGTVIRMFFLQKHYRSPIDFTQDGIRAAEQAVVRLKTFYSNLVGVEPRQSTLPASGDTEEIDQSFGSFVKFLEDDLDTPGAVATLFDLVRLGNKLITQGAEENQAALTHLKSRIEAINSILGVIPTLAESGGDRFGRVLDLMVNIRRELRSKKEWELADRIRDQLREIGIILEDRGEKSGWRVE